MRESPYLLQLAEVLDKAKRTSSKKEKVALLSGYLAGLSPEDATIAARIASGRSSERGSADETEVGYSTILDAIKEVTGATEQKFSETYLRHGDLGEVAEEILAHKREQTLFQEPLRLKDVDEAFTGLRSAKGKGSVGTRRAIVKSLMLRASPIEAKYLVKVLTAEMRTGVVSGLLEEAIAAAYGISKEEAARAHMVVGDLGLLARLASEGKTASVNVEQFRPVNFMLAQPLATAAEVAEHFGKEVYAEYKYDGVRAQLHKKGTAVRLYSRRLEDITASFPEVAEAFSVVKKDFILDGEIVPFSDGRPLPFQLLQRRLRRMEKFEEAAQKSPVVYFAFDALLLGGRELVDLPLSRRRQAVRSLVTGSAARIAESTEVRTEEQILKAFRKSRELGYEGLVVKDPGSVYSMGGRGSGWVKLKEELDTLDAVIVAAEYGHGKRAGVISDYTFAVRDGSRLRTVGKAYSGLSDAEIGEMTKKLKEITLEDQGYRRTVRPEIVVEVAFDSIQKSDRHDSGFALRFPRIKQIRADKSVEQIDTIGRVAEIFQGQKVKVEGP